MGHDGDRRGIARRHPPGGASPVGDGGCVSSRPRLRVARARRLSDHDHRVVRRRAADRDAGRARAGQLGDARHRSRDRAAGAAPARDVDGHGSWGSVDRPAVARAGLVLRALSNRRISAHPADARRPRRLGVRALAGRCQAPWSLGTERLSRCLGLLLRRAVGLADARAELRRSRCSHCGRTSTAPSC